MELVREKLYKFYYHIANLGYKYLVVYLKFNSNLALKFI